VPSAQVHLLEPTGFGGIFQHTCALAVLLHASGADVTLHTSAQHEEVELGDVKVCRCIWWPHDRQNTKKRRALIAARLLTGGLRHVDRAAEPGSIIHVEGGTASGLLTALTLLMARRRRRHVVYSPHNTFSRRSTVDAAMLHLCLQLSDQAIGYSQSDVAALNSAGVEARFSPLIQLVPLPSDEAKADWRRRWEVPEDGKAVLFAGQIRPDKRLDLLVRSAAAWPEDRRLAVVGQDRGAWDSCLALADELGVEVSATLGFASLDDFTAAIAAADVLVAPYERASQSGVLSIARQVGVPSIASDIGGLGELADRTVPMHDVDALTVAIDEQLQSPPPTARLLDEELALEAHLGAYGARPACPPRAPGTRTLPASFIAWSANHGRCREISAAARRRGACMFDLAISHRPLVPLRYAGQRAAHPRYLIPAGPASLSSRTARFPVLLCLITRARKVPDRPRQPPHAFGREVEHRGEAPAARHRWLAPRSTSSSWASTRAAPAGGGTGAAVGSSSRGASRGALPPRQAAGPAGRCVLWIGVFASDEPVGVVMEAAARLPDVDFVLTGDLRRVPLDPEAAPPNVSFSGYLRGHQYRQAVADCDVVLALTDDATSALRAASEATYGEKPLVISDLPHLAELFPHALRVVNDGAAVAAGVAAALAGASSSAEARRAARVRELDKWRTQEAELRARPPASGHCLRVTHPRRLEASPHRSVCRRRPHVPSIS
jgi:glycosyltransferase involved in cell wall biosynthesis